MLARLNNCCYILQISLSKSEVLICLTTFPMLRQQLDHNIVRPAQHLQEFMTLGNNKWPWLQLHNSVHNYYKNAQFYDQYN